MCPPPLLPRLSVEFFACARQSFTELGTRAMISVSASPSLQGVLLGGGGFILLHSLCMGCIECTALYCVGAARQQTRRASSQCAKCSS